MQAFEVIHTDLSTMYMAQAMQSGTQENFKSRLPRPISHHASCYMYSNIYTNSYLCSVINIQVMMKHGVKGGNVIFEVFTAVTTKNAVFWDIKAHFVLHRRHITSPLWSPA
jgi:hypothetical protein